MCCSRPEQEALVLDLRSAFAAPETDEDLYWQHKATFNFAALECRGRTMDGNWAITSGLRRDGREPVYRQLYDLIREAIVEGTFPDGARLPSSRSLATQLALSRTTVDLAYNLLAGDGLVQGRTAKGTLVTSGVPAPKVTGSASMALSASLPSALPLTPGRAAIDLFPRKIWSRLATRYAKSLLPEDLVVRDPMGHPRLREAIANRLRLVRGMTCDVGQVFITAGASGAVLLAATALGAQSGSTIAALATPAGPVCRALGALGMRIEPPDLASLIANRWPAAAMAVLNAEDLEMRGRPFDVELGQALAQWARQNSAWLIEEDGDLDLFHEGPQRSMLARGLTSQVSFYLGSFERSLFPAIDCGFLVVPQVLIDRFTAAAEQSPWYAPIQVQRVLSDFITQGYIGRHANCLRRAHVERRQLTLAALRKGQVTGQLRFEAVGSSLVAPLEANGDSERFRLKLQASVLGPVVLSMPDLPHALLQIGYAGTPPKDIATAIEQLNSLLMRL